MSAGTRAPFTEQRFVFPRRPRHEPVLNAAQAFNSFGAVVTPIIGATFILSGVDYTAAVDSPDRDIPEP
jgi:fucose permease